CGNRGFSSTRQSSTWHRAKCNSNLPNLVLQILDANSLR
ncbi:hypothetical protein A2U01_0115945, partial [Trifolium medium]|nr:hypothetical protein [Trifolium medium]